jgi:archaetidylinositol phosphate synthase
MSHNTWIHRGVRALVRPLVKTAVTPNHLTTLRLAFGIGAAAAFAAGTRDWQVIGAGIFVVSMVLDRADGELARQSGKTSSWGHAYDLFSDSFCNAIAFVGIGIGLMNGPLGGWAVLMGLLAGGAIASILLMVVRVEALAGARAAELSGGAGFDPDDAMLVVPVVIWLDATQGLLYAAAIGAPTFAIFFYLRFRSVLHGAG